MALHNALTYLRELPAIMVWCIFLAMITVSVLVVGGIVRSAFMRRHQWRSYTVREWLWCAATNVINTAVTFAGFLLWKSGRIDITFSSSFAIVLIDFTALFMTMDLLMYVFHFLIHKTFLYRMIHGLHHQAVDPKPMDLFILHPAETFCFGALWLLVLVAHAFNIYAIILYLIVNVAFGLVGHLGFEIIPDAVRRRGFWKYIGTSAFHHDHHRDVKYNFGFYTSLWDRMMRTYKE